MSDVNVSEDSYDMNRSRIDEINQTPIKGRNYALEDSHKMPINDPTLNKSSIKIEGEIDIRSPVKYGNSFTKLDRL